MGQAIARAVQILVTVDGTVRIIETDCTTTGVTPVYATFCETAEEAIDFLRDTSALSINPAWYGAGSNQ